MLKQGVIYTLVNRTRIELSTPPYFYIGSKGEAVVENNVIFGKNGNAYWGSPGKNNLLLEHKQSDLIELLEWYYFEYEVRSELNAEERCCMDTKSSNIIKDEKYYNLGFPSGPHNEEGYFHVVDINTNEHKQVSLEEFEQSDNLDAFSKGFVNCRDRNTDEILRVTKEEYKSNDGLVDVKYGKVIVKDTRDDRNKWVLKEEFDKFGYYISVHKNMVPVIDTRTGESLKVTKEEYHQQDFYANHLEGMVNVVDIKTGKSTQVSREVYRNNEQYESVSCRKVNVVDLITKEGRKATQEEFEKDYSLVARTFVGWYITPKGTYYDRAKAGADLGISGSTIRDRVKAGKPGYSQVMLIDYPDHTDRYICPVTSNKCRDLQ